MYELITILHNCITDVTEYRWLKQLKDLKGCYYYLIII